MGDRNGWRACSHEVSRKHEKMTMKHNQVSTRCMSIQRYLDVRNVVTTSKRRSVLTRKVTIQYTNLNDYSFLTRVIWGDKYIYQKHFNYCCRIRFRVNHVILRGRFLNGDKFNRLTIFNTMAKVWAALKSAGRVMLLRHETPIVLRIILFDALASYCVTKLRSHNFGHDISSGSKFGHAARS